MQLIQSDTLHISTDAGTPQSNGFREGSPDSPVLFAGLVADRLHEILTERESTHLPLPTSLHGRHLPLVAHQSTSAGHSWRVESALQQDGLRINGGETQCICSQQGQGEIQVGNQQVQIQGPEASMKVLGATSPWVDRCQLRLHISNKRRGKLGTPTNTSSKHIGDT